MTERIVSSSGKIKDWRSRPRKFHVDRDWFYQKYAVELTPTRLIAEEIGCVNEHVTAIAKKLGIPVRPRQPRSIPHKRRAELDDKEIVRLYVQERMAIAKIGALFGCTDRPVAKRLKELGVKIRHHNDTKRGKPARNKINIDPDVVASMYGQKFVSGQTIADHFGVSRQVIHRVMKDYGIPKKPMGEARDFAKEKHPLWRVDLSPKERETRRDAVKQKEWREQVFGRDGYTCHKCRDDRGGNLQAHHIVPHSKDRSIAWDLDNGITLCKPCHVEFHTVYGYTKCTADDLEEYVMKEAK